jgi:site-specific DNA-adenine methylase
MIRYPGAKNKIAQFLASIYGGRIENFVEPFAGSAGGFRALYHYIGKALLGDRNPKVAQLLLDMQKDPETIKNEFLKITSRMPVENKDRLGDPAFVSDVYNKIRQGEFSGIDRTAANLVVGNYSKSYIPESAPLFKPGKYAIPSNRAAMIESIGKSLQEKATIRNQSWQETLEEVKSKKGKFLFIDPPYYKTRGYTGSGGGMTEQERAELAESLNNAMDTTKGVYFDSKAGMSRFFPEKQSIPVGNRVSDEQMLIWGDW